MATEFEKLLIKGRRRQRWRSLLSKLSAPRTALLIAVFLGAAILASDRRLPSPMVLIGDRKELPRVVNGGNAWGGFEATASESSQRTPLVVSGLVTHVRDGDTIEVGEIAIRLAKLDCAEKGTTEGDAATKKMKQLVSGLYLECNLTGERSYDRNVGSCRLSDGRDVGRLMITTGACTPWR